MRTAPSARVYRLWHIGFHELTDQCRRRRRRRGEEEFCVFSIWIWLQVDRIATLLPTTTPTNRRGRSYIYTLPPAHPPTRVSTTAATGTYALVGFEGIMDIDMASMASLSLRRSGSGSTSGSRGPSRLGSESRSRSKSKSKSRHEEKAGEKEKDHRQVGVAVPGRVPVRRLTRGWVRRRI